MGCVLFDDGCLVTMVWAIISDCWWNEDTQGAGSHQGQLYMSPCYCLHVPLGSFSYDSEISPHQTRSSVNKEAVWFLSMKTIAAHIFTGMDLMDSSVVETF